MRTLRTIAELRAALAEPRRASARIGLVPTMGAFHEGHLSLMRRAREECDRVVVSLFVNPVQFNEQSDLDAYPRPETHDLALAEATGVDIVFAPAAQEMYPPGFASSVSVSGLTEVLEGANRSRSHFDGVTTVVLKLFNIVAPDVAYFGQKDIQQARVIERMVLDLNLDLEIAICPIVRESDGLAMSSRNVHLSADERARATALHRALEAAAQSVADGERDGAAIAAAGRSELSAAGLRADYFELVDAESFSPITTLDGRPALAVVAARVGETRLIDNHPLSTAR